MPLSFSEEMLSAYLDGEATPDERALVERLLDEKPELRDQLNALSDLSQAVQKLPRETAPASFASSVLNEVNHRRPTPSKSQTEDVATSTETLRRSPRFWVSSLIAMSILVVAGVFLNTPQEYKDAEMAHLENVSNSSREGTVADISIDDYSTVNSEAMPATAVGADDSSFGLSMEPESVVRAGMSLAANSPRVVTLDRNEIALRLSSLQDSPDVGDQFSVLTKDQGSPILVDFVVVDVQKSWDSLQVLLKDHSVEPVIVDSNGGGIAPESSGEMISIYLDLDEPVLETVLGQVNALDAVVFLSDETLPIMNSSLAGALEEELVSRPQSLAYQAPKNLQEEPKSQASLSPLAAMQDADQFGRTYEKQFRFDIKEARLTQKTMASSDSPMPAYQYSRMERSSNESLTEVSNGLPQTPPPVS